MTIDLSIYQECPHCYSNVMFRPNGQCPSCQKSRSNKQGIDPNATMITIDNNHRIPGCCFLCGKETKLKKTFSWSYANADTASLLVRLFSHFPGSAYRESHSITMPVCADCLPATKKVKPLSVRAGFECRMVVHRTFREKFEALNGKEYVEWEADIRLGRNSGGAGTGTNKTLLSQLTDFIGK